MPTIPVPTANYDCTQQELYSIADTMYGNIPTDLADFLLHKPLKYVPLFLSDIAARRTTAMGMKDDTQTSSVHETLKQELTDMRVICTDNFGKLKSYIVDGFPENVHKTKFDEAGQLLMGASLKNNWEKVVDLNKKVKDFIAAYPTELDAGFMPVGFAGDVNTAITNYDLKYSAFKNARQTGTATGGKIKANNLVDKDMKSIQSDAFVIFKYDAEKLKRYTITVIKSIVSPPGSASLKITCKQAVTNVLMVGLDITIKSKDGIAQTGVTDATGVLVFDNIDPADYTVTVKVVGHPDMVIAKEVNTGTAARLDVSTPA